MVLQSIVVDDEIIARTSLTNLCSKSSNIDFKSSFDSGQAALDYLEKEPVDLIFLDVEMPGMTGIELLDQMVSLPQVILTSSNIDYAYDAFEYEVIDFLKKPFSQPRFLKSVEKAIQKIEQLESLASISAQKEIYVKVDGKLTRIPFEDIICFENVGDYIKVCTAIKSYIIYGTIKALDKKITHPRFIKIHRSYIINLDKVKDIKDNSVLIERKVIPISRAHKPILLKAINIL